MRSLETDTRQRGQRASGFSLIEMMIVVALIIVLASITVVSLVPVLKQQRVTNAYNTTLAAMRQARDNAVAQRTSYSVTFSNTVSPNTITVAPTVLGFQGDQNTMTYQLPTDVTFQTNSAISSTAAPDSGAGASFGAGANAIDFGYTATSNNGGQNIIYFCPDGSAQTASCTETVSGTQYSTVGGYSLNWDDGVVYLARSGDLLSSRAITLWGGTGRIHGWRLYPSGGNYQWIRQ
jgi:prepilin-type N-terminal cleavage/methylation domain-containing protein